MDNKGAVILYLLHNGRRGRNENLIRDKTNRIVYLARKRLLKPIGKR